MFFLFVRTINHIKCFYFFLSFIGMYKCLQLTLSVWGGTVFIPQILTYKEGPRTERIEICIMNVDP